MIGAFSIVELSVSSITVKANFFPFGQNLLISNVGIGIFLWIALSSIQPIGLLMRLFGKDVLNLKS